MRILTDTNILISALLFPDSVIAKTLLYITANHELVLCSRNIDEFYDVINRKRPDKTDDINTFLSELSFELIPEETHGEKQIRDTKDQPILNAAIKHHIDIILTGDKDFLSLDLQSPFCMNVTDFLYKENIKF